jgi:hypothetical protein
MDTNITSFWEILLWSFWIFIWISAVMIWFRCVFDMFSDKTLSGWGKAGWAIVLVFLPWIGALIYLIARGKSMGERQVAAISAAQAQPGGVHPAGRREELAGRPDRQRQVAARLRCDQPEPSSRP